MGIFNNIKNFLGFSQKEYETLAEKRQFVEKPPVRIAQEKELENYKKIANRIDNTGFVLLLEKIEHKMDINPFMTFESDFLDIKNYIDNNLTDKDKFLLMEKTYKFSKSNQEFTKYFSESHWYEYNEHQGYAYDDGKPLSVTVNSKKILFCAMYGDQITIFTNNPKSKYYDKLKNANIKNVGTMFSEYQSDFLIIDKNLSLSDPYVLKTIMKSSDAYALHDYFNRTINNKTFAQIYEEIGFSETALFYQKAKESFYQYGLSFKEKLDEILPDKEKDNMLDAYIFSKTSFVNDKENINVLNDEERFNKYAR